MQFWFHFNIYLSKHDKVCLISYTKNNKPRKQDSWTNTCIWIILVLFFYASLFTFGLGFKSISSAFASSKLFTFSCFWVMKPVFEIFRTWNVAISIWCWQFTFISCNFAKIEMIQTKLKCSKSSLFNLVIEGLMMISNEYWTWRQKVWWCQQIEQLRKSKITSFWIN